MPPVNIYEARVFVTPPKRFAAVLAFKFNFKLELNERQTDRLNLFCVCIYAFGRFFFFDLTALQDAISRDYRRGAAKA